MGDSFGGFMQLPIRKRGHFKKDDFFKDFQDDFSSAIQNVMDRHAGRSLLADQFSIYRKMRENTQDTTGPAASISETKDSTVIVLDMSDFIKGSIAVRTKGRNAIVEASYESKSFSKEFPLPYNTNFDGVKTAMSNEGILTITAPKKEVGTPKDNESSLRLNIGEPEISERTTSSSEESRSSALDGKEDTEPPLSPSAKDRTLSIIRKGNFFQDEYFENVWKDFEKAMDEMVQSEEHKRAEPQEERFREKKELVNKLKSEMFMDADRRQNDFFEKARQKESMADLGVQDFIRMNSYRNLRSWAPESETQATTVTQDTNGYKIVMDVKNFGTDGGDISVKASEGHLAVTGRKGSLTFTKEFTLNGLTNPEQVNASVSEDGVLTVTVTA